MEGCGLTPKQPRTGMWPVPKPASNRVCSPKEAGGREAGGPRSNLLSRSSLQMLGTVSINGLETQVRAIRKLPDASLNRSLWTRRLNEARSWKRGDETAIAFMPGVGEDSQGEDAGAQEAAVGVRLSPGPAPSVQEPRPVFLQAPAEELGISVLFCFDFPYCTLSTLSGHTFLRDPCPVGVFPSYTHSHEP